MTDKVQKILSEIATRKLCTMDEHMAFYNDKAKEDYRFLGEIEEIFKGMQEEPASEDLEEAASEWDNKASFSPFYMVMDGDNPIDVKQDITTHAESFKAGAQWQKERDNIPQELIDAYWKFQKIGGDSVRDFINAANGYNTHKEPVSKDYEKALNSEAVTFLQSQQIVPNFYASTIIDAVKHGAKWQRQQDEHLIWQISSANYKKGKQDAIEEMMKDAFTGTVWLNEEKQPYVPVFVGLKGKNPGDKVKLIVIKED